MHNSFPVSFSGALVLSKIIHTLVLICTHSIGRIKEASKAMIHSYSLNNVTYFLVLLTLISMDCALTLPFLSQQSISRPLSSIISFIMVKVKTLQKSISGNNIPSYRYEPPTLTDQGSAWRDANNVTQLMVWYQPQQAHSLGTNIHPLEPICYIP